MDRSFCFDKRKGSDTICTWCVDCFGEIGMPTLCKNLNNTVMMILCNGDYLYFC